MKKKIKLFALMLAVVMLFGAVGCNQSETSSNSSEGEAGVLIGGFGDETVDTNNGDAASLGGSGGSTSGGSTSGGSTSGGGTVVSEPVEMSGSDPFANIPARLNGTTVTFAHWGDEGATEYEKVLKAFTKKTGIKYKLVSYDQAQYVSRVSQQIAAKSGPDVIIVGQFPASLEILQPLQNIIDLNDDFWDDNITEVYTVGGNTYAVNSLEGIWEDIDAVQYNKRLFADNGLKSPLDYFNEGNWTWESFRKCAEELKKLGYVGGYADPEKINASLGSPMISYNPKTATFTAATAAQLTPGYQFSAQMFKDGLWTTTDWWGTFANGKVGMMVGGYWGAKYNGCFKDMPDSDLGMVPMPSSINGQACKPSGSPRAYGIAKGAKNPEGAAYLLRYFLDYSNYAAANAQALKSKSLEKMIFETIVPEIKSKGIIYDFSGCAFLLTNSETGDVTSDAYRADPAQVATVLAGKQNIINNAAQKANDKIASFR